MNNDTTNEAGARTQSLLEACKALRREAFAISRKYINATGDIKACDALAHEIMRAGEAIARAEGSAT